MVFWTIEITQIITLHDGWEWKRVLGDDLIRVIHDEAEEGELWNVHLKPNHLVPDGIVTWKIQTI